MFKFKFLIVILFISFGIFANNTITYNTSTTNTPTLNQQSNNTATFNSQSNNTETNNPIPQPQNQPVVDDSRENTTTPRNNSF